MSTVTAALMSVVHGSAGLQHPSAKILNVTDLQVLYVPLPPPDGRVSILRALTRKTPLAPDVDLAAIGTHPAAGDYSGADLAALVREACVLALKVQQYRNAYHCHCL